MLPDLDLVEQCKSGDQNAFRALVERHQQQVRGTVIGMIGANQEAEDVAQEVFIRFYRSLEDFRGDSKLGTYLTRIAINLSLNELKRQQRRNRRFLFFEKNEKVFQIEDTSANPSRKDTQEMVQHALQRLEPNFRSVIVLRMIDGYSVKETAEILKLPQGTIASRLARGQKKLKEILSTYL